ncbi:MAG: AAA family ATPase, partial [bacterium]
MARYKIGFSFSGTYEKRIEGICEALCSKGYRKEELFFCNWHPHIVGGADADTTLRRIYFEECDLVVVLLSEDYHKKHWPYGVEWRSIKNLINQGKGDMVFLLSTGEIRPSDFDGLYDYGSIHITIDGKDDAEVAGILHKKYRTLYPDSVPPHDLIGRDAQIEEVNQFLDSSPRARAWVWGPPGIGKTSLCQAVMGLRREEIPFLNVTGAEKLDAFHAAIARSLGLRFPEGLRPEEYGAFLAQALNEYETLYFDNWEDIWYATAQDEEARRALSQWLNDLRPRLIVSSRDSVSPLRGNLKKFEVRELGEADARALFLRKVEEQRPLVEAEKAALPGLLQELGGHPLAILLTASQAQNQPLTELLQKWHIITDSVDDNPRHRSLSTALRISWEAVRGDGNAVLIWGLLAQSILPIPLSALAAMRPEGVTEEAWEAARRSLVKASLCRYTEDMGAL